MAEVGVQTEYVGATAIVRYTVRTEAPEAVTFTLPDQTGLRYEGRTFVDGDRAVAEYLFAAASTERRFTVHGGLAVAPDDGSYTLPATLLSFPPDRCASLVLPPDVDADICRHASVTASIVNGGNDRLEPRMIFKGHPSVKFLGVTSAGAFYSAADDSVLLPSLLTSGTMLVDALFHVDVVERDSRFDFALSIADKDGILAEGVGAILCKSGPVATDCSIALGAPAAALGSSVPVHVRLRNTGTASPVKAELRLYAPETARLTFDGAAHAIIDGKRCSIITMNPQHFGPFSPTVEMYGQLHLPRAGDESQVLTVAGKVIFGDESFIIPSAEIVGVGSPDVVAEACAVIGVTGDGDVTDMRFGDRAQLVTTLLNNGSAPATAVSFEFLAPPELAVETESVVVGDLLPGAQYTQRFDVVMRRSVARGQRDLIRPRERYNGDRFRTLPGVPVLLRGTARLVSTLAEIVVVGSDRYVARFSFCNDGDGNAAEVRIRATLPEALMAVDETVTLNGRAVSSVSGSPLSDLCLRHLIVGGTATIAFDMVATPAAGGYLEAVSLTVECETASLDMQARYVIEAARTVDARNVSYADIAEALDEPFPYVAPAPPALECAAAEAAVVVRLEPLLPFLEPADVPVAATPAETSAGTIESALPESTLADEDVLPPPEEPATECAGQEPSAAVAAGNAGETETHEPESDAETDATTAGSAAGNVAHEEIPVLATPPAVEPQPILDGVPPVPVAAPIVPLAAIHTGTAFAGATASRLDQTFASSAGIIVDREHPNGYLQALALRTLLPEHIAGSQETQAAYDVVRSLNSPIVKRKISTLMLDTYSPNESWLMDLISSDLHDALRKFIVIAQRDETLAPVLGKALAAAITGEPPFAEAPVNNPRATAALLALVDGTLITPASCVASYLHVFIAEVANGWTLGYPIPKSVDDAFASILAGVVVSA